VLPPDKNGVLFVEVTIRLVHHLSSTGPAYLINLRQQLSSILKLVSYSFETTGNLIAGSTSNLNGSLLAFNMEVLPLGDVLTISYLARIDSVEGNITDGIMVSYTTIDQEGIGAEVS
jgi:hypothetical protein